jgi:hypothetical protein
MTENVLGTGFHRWSCLLLGSIALLRLTGCADARSEGTGSQEAATTESAQQGEEIPFSQAKLLVEHNATAGDTGFQGFVDGEPWRELKLSGPDGRTVVAIQARGELRKLGLTELFFETDEPSNEDVPIDELLASLPAGQYQYEGRSVEGLRMEGTALLTHDIPAEPFIVSPLEGAVVDRNAVVIDWDDVTASITGADIALVAYQLIVEKDVEPHPNAFATPLLSVHVPPTVTSMTVPSEFLEPGTSYKVEVLAIEESGNQTISESRFETM